MHPALHPVLPALTAKRALWGVWHQAWLSCMERSLGKTTHSCRSPVSLLLRSSGMKEAEEPACRNCSPLCQVLASKQELSSGLQATSKEGDLSSLTELPLTGVFSMVSRNIGLPHPEAEVSLLLDTHLGHQEVWQFLSFHSVFPKSLRSASKGKRPKKERLRPWAHTRKEPLPHSTHNEIISAFKQ